MCTLSGVSDNFGSESDLTDNFGFGHTVRYLGTYLLFGVAVVLEAEDERVVGGFESVNSNGLQDVLGRHLKQIKQNSFPGSG